MFEIGNYVKYINQQGKLGCYGVNPEMRDGDICVVVEVGYQRLRIAFPEGDSRNSRIAGWTFHPDEFTLSSLGGSSEPSFFD